MRILFLAEGHKQQQATMHRVTEFAAELSKHYIHADILYGKRYRFGKYDFCAPKIGNYFKSIVKAPNYQVLFIQRASNIGVYLVVQIWKFIGKKIIFDFDDALFLLRNPVHSRLNQILGKVNAVTVGSHSLKEYAERFNDNVYLIPAPVNTDWFKPIDNKRKTDRTVTIGWLGHAPVHSDNLKLIVEPLRILGHKYRNLRFKIVTALGSQKVKDVFKEVLNVEIDYGLETWASLEDVPKLISDFDISIMPLQNTEWSQGKCAQKIIESMSMEIPVIASNVGENKYVIENGVNGFLVSDTEEWVRYLSLLIKDGSLRRKMGKEGREMVKKNYSLRVCGKRLANILNKIADNRFSRNSKLT